MHRLRSLTPLMAVTLAVSACGSGTDGSATESTVPASTSTAPEDPLTSTTVGVTEVSLMVANPPGFAGLYSSVAFDQGLFERQHLDLELLQADLHESRDVFDAVLAGTANFGVVSQILAAETANEDGTTSVAVLTGRAPTIVSLPAVGVGAVADLEGLRIGVGEDYFYEDSLPYVLAEAGLTLDEVTVETLRGDDRWEAVIGPLLSGEVDAVLAWDGIEFELVEREVDYDYLALDENGAPLASGFLIVNSAFADANPSAVTSFLAATFEAVAATIDNYPAAVDSYRSHFASDTFDDIPGDVALRSFCRIGSGQIGAPSKTYLAKSLQLYAEEFGGPEDATVESVYTDEYLPEELLPCEVG